MQIKYLISVRDLHNFVGPGSVPDFENFLGPGPISAPDISDRYSNFISVSLYQ